MSRWTARFGLPSDSHSANAGEALSGCAFARADRASRGARQRTLSTMYNYHWVRAFASRATGCVRMSNFARPTSDERLEQMMMVGISTYTNGCYGEP